MLGAITAPLMTILGLFNAPLQNLVGLIDARIEQLEAQGDTSGAERPPPTRRPRQPPSPSPSEAEAEAAEPSRAWQQKQTPKRQPKKKERTSNGQRS